MEFPFGTTVKRLRAKPILDPYSQEQIAEDWSDPDEVDLDGAYVGGSSTSRVLGESRTQALEARSLYCAPDADVRLGDKIQDGSKVYEVDGIPDAETNPFTGWQPVREIPLRRGLG